MEMTYVRRKREHQKMNPHHCREKIVQFNQVDYTENETYTKSRTQR